MSAGFLFVLFVAALVVVIPTAAALRFAWLRGGVARGASAFLALLLAALAWLSFVATGWPNSLEEKAVVFFAIWGLIFVVSGAATFVVCMVRRVLKKPERSIS